VVYTFIVGCARSGTSILGELIASNPNVKYIFEASNIWELGGMGENESHRLTAQHATKPVKRQIREWFEKQAGDAGILVEKSPRNSLRVPYVKEIFPEAKFISIVRDGRDVACSMVPGCGGSEWNHLKPPSWQEYFKNYSGAIRCAHVWKQVLEITLEDLPKVPHLQIRYEDLLASPQSIAKAIFDFMGAGLHPDTVEFCQKITSSTSSSYHAKHQDHWYRDDHSIRVGRWRENLSDGEEKIITPLLEPLLTTFGYINRTPIEISKVSLTAKNREKSGKQDNKRLVVVLGMHRSGTSAIARGLQVMGVDLGNSLVPPIKGVNDKGFWEDADINELDVEMLFFLKNDWHYLTPIQPSDIDTLERNGFLQRGVKMVQEKTAGIEIFGIKDPRIAKLLPFWKKVFEQSHLKASYALSLRHPLSVCQSLMKRDGFDFEKSYLLWMEHVISSLVHTEDEHCVVVDFDRLMQSPDEELLRVAEAFNLTLDSSELERFKTDFLDEGLRHTVYELHEPEFEKTVPPLVKEIYEELLKVAKDSIRLDDPTLRNKIIQWNTELSRIRAALVLADKLTSKLSLAEIEKNQLLQAKDGEIAARDWEIAARDREIAARDWEIDAREKIIEAKDKAYQNLATEMAVLQSSRTWKLAMSFRELRARVFPPGSRRETLARNLYQYSRKFLSTFSRALSTIRLSVRRNGLPLAIIKGFRILGVYLYHSNEKILHRRRYNNELKEMDALIAKHTGFFDLFHVPMGWKTVLFQRFQHMSLQMAKMGGLALYGGHPIVDRGIMVFQKATNNLYIFDATNHEVVDRILRALEAKPQPRILRIQSIDLVTTEEDVNRFVQSGFTVVYEYIDEINPAITGSVPDSVYQRHTMILRDERVIVVATSDQLYEEVQRVRSKNFILSTNGVDLDHWRIAKGQPPDDLRPALNGNLIVGYHGALAKWMDYELLRMIADEGSYELVLIGHEHDAAFAESGIKDHPRVHFLGSKSYFELNKYAIHYDIAILPFKKTELTQAVSPVKIFEYMAACKPVVTTDLRECKKYQSCLVAGTHLEFMDQLKRAAALRTDRTYLDLLEKEARENSWEAKTVEILGLAGVKI
jgi:glycosyltransferase involved in cell wall biosynthesis